MTSFKAIFARSVDLVETDYYTKYLLTAETLTDAEGEALALDPPPDANVIKILNEDEVVRRTWLALG